MIEYLVLISSG